jgi:hypothetical protein
MTPEVGKLYELHGFIFYPGALSDNENTFKYVGFCADEELQIEGDPIHEFQGVVDGQIQVVYQSTLDEEGEISITLLD